MAKRIVSIFSAMCILFCCCVPAFAANDVGKIKLKLFSDVAGCTEKNTENFIKIEEGNVVYGSTLTGTQVSVSDYAGSTEPGRIVAGRTYYVDYYLSAAEGCSLPEKAEDLDISIECGKGVKVISTQITSAQARNADGEFVHHRGLKIYARVLADGNVFQRIGGIIYDIVLKIKAWSLY